MARYFIKSISIEGFRGVNNNNSPLLIDFQSDGVTSIFGENGKGKSSIFEAFLFSILGRIIRLDEYHIDIRDKGAIKNLFHPGDGNIKIEFIDDLNIITDINVQVNSNGLRTISSTTIPNPESFLSSLCNSLNFLDYKSFEKIMISSSEDTGKLFSNLVGFGRFIDIKEKLDKISRTQNLNTDFGKNTRENRIRENNQEISKLKNEIKNKLDEIGIKQVTFNEKEIFNKIKLFTSKLSGEKVKTVTVKSNIDFDLLIKTKIGTTYEDDALRLNSEKENLEKVKSLNISLRKFSKKSINTLSKKLNAAYSQINHQLI